MFGYLSPTFAILPTKLPNTLSSFVRMSEVRHRETSLENSCGSVDGLVCLGTNVDVAANSTCMSPAVREPVARSST